MNGELKRLDPFELCVDTLLKLDALAADLAARIPGDGEGRVIVEAVREASNMLGCLPDALENGAPSQVTMDAFTEARNTLTAITRALGAHLTSDQHAQVIATVLNARKVLVAFEVSVARWYLARASAAVSQ